MQIIVLSGYSHLFCFSACLDRPAKMIRMSVAPLYLLWFVVLALACSSCAWSEPASEEWVKAPSPERQAELLYFVRQDCGSCHGLLLHGGLGPPLTPSALKDKPVAALTGTILYGRHGTAMPPWKSFLSESETEWIVQMLLKGLP